MAHTVTINGHSHDLECKTGICTSHLNKTLPKTLFGTSLEKIDSESLKNIEGRYIIEGSVRNSAERYPLPQRLKDLIPGREQLESSREEFNKQKQILDEAEQKLKSKAENALIFKVDPANNHFHLSTPYKPSWLSQKDLEHSKEINSLGLNVKESYNRDKYGTKPLRHAYSLIGDPLAVNMDFNSSKNTDTLSQNHIVYSKGRHLPYGLMKQTKPDNLKSIFPLPPNIRHKFGSRDCDVLLSDEHLVHLALLKQSNLAPQKVSRKENHQHLPVDLSGNYESLGHLTRYNVCSGISTDNKISNTKQDFNDLVHLRRVPNPDQFRYQRDELSAWAEHNVLRERMKKAWNEQHPLGGHK
ncbi:uncharacterized protein LOC106078389 [Biomphalaria glabrata]|uniref:Uncharacterized protein LOC106078389 n=1 Tax=Biomphalaria glabrata TaxID=6526 RepID=A0A2C9L3R8_BIOGL|nr:uncharacterized protein LOC106078389 [Biomphalaria glabrata]XP_013094812.1 uncharacterized protein LOC106078389 [Biomphalaria glabrata]XP_013094886.1 uncharacterized protein LOC106078389 [Biomphalaria glabrata]XP_013095052.1 uncharacterized protein LOC106078389 [Biomphalaria glabrata]XP_013095139.1 uncharacterized protein LOC106078389 [Biomphalaria glabrata]XP_013095285.1 uncharacterized protein LOC106078389 [Biomphalaria glabrata]XP_055877052.1 uncharacterized protein LOC106078389 [Biomph